MKKQDHLPIFGGGPVYVVSILLPAMPGFLFFPFYTGGF